MTEFMPRPQREKEREGEESRLWGEQAGGTKLGFI